MPPSSPAHGLTPNAVHHMISGEAYSKPLVVRLFNFDGSARNNNFQVATVCDTVHSTSVLLPLSLTAKLSKQRNDSTWDHIISIKGYITSEANTVSEPVLVLVNAVVFQRKPPFRASVRSKLRPIKFQPKQVQPGDAGTFLADHIQFFSTADLAGTTAVCFDHHDPQLQEVSKAFARHSALMTLHSHALEANNDNESSAGGDTSSVPEATASHSASHAAENDLSALKEFSSSQLDRQEASLISHIDRSDRPNVVVHQHRAVLQAATSYKGDLTPEILCQWHSILVGDGLHEGAGKFRQKAVRAGQTRFAPVDQIQTQVERFCLGMRTLSSRFRQHRDDNPLDKVTCAAAALFGVVDIQPFADGNGRVARIAANWALSKVGLPFPVHCFATTSQRQEFIIALQQTRRNIHLVTRGEVGGVQGNEKSNTILNGCCCAVGLLLPVVRLLLDRIAKACVEPGGVVKISFGIRGGRRESRAAIPRKGSRRKCIICFDEKPNIATLCCGKAVHLNCIAQWLSSKDSCPQCRAQMPTMERVAPAAANNAANNNHDRMEDLIDDIFIDTASTSGDFESATLYDTTEETTEIPVDPNSDTSSMDDSTVVADDNDDQAKSNGNNNAGANNRGGDNDNDDTTTYDDTRVVDVANHNQNDQAAEDDYGTFSTTEDDPMADTTEDDDVANQYETATTDSFDMTTTDDDTRSAATPPTHNSNTPPVCGSEICRNRAAIDCSNHYCGRCCVLLGYYQCDRHNT